MHNPIAHDDHGCHQVSETPKEMQQITINTNSHTNGEINVGFYSKGKWFRRDYSEINVKNIVCWHSDEYLK